MTAEQLQALRTKRGLSQHDLSRATGIKQCRIAQWESGSRDPRSMRVMDAVRLCKALGEKVEMVFGEKENAK